MLFSSRIPLPALVQWCRALRHSLDIGLSPVKIFRQQAKSGPSAIRPLAAQLADRLQKGNSLQDALAPDRKRFPMLFVELIAVGEETGRLTEVFIELEHYFETVQTSRKQLYSALAWPIIMYLAAIGIVGLLILILGMLPPGTDGKPTVRPFGSFMIGPRGAAVFFVVAAAFTAAVVAAFFYVRDNDPLQAKLEGLSLGIPVLSGCFRAFALQRFSLAMFMTHEAGLRADKGLLLAFRATSNDAYRKKAEAAAKDVRKGNEITPVLAECGSKLFPDEFVSTVEVGETTGQIAEVMQKQALYYRDEAVRKLKVLVMLLGGAIYALIAIMVIVMIFKIAMAAYIGPLNEAVGAADNPDAWLRGK